MDSQENKTNCFPWDLTSSVCITVYCHSGSVSSLGCLDTPLLFPTPGNTVGTSRHLMLETEGASHLLEMTGQTIPVAMIISFLIKSWIVSTKGNIFHQKLFEKAYFIFRLSSQAWFGQPVLTNGKCPEPILWQLLLTYIRFLSTTLFTLIALCSLYSLQTTTGKMKKIQRLFITNDKQKYKVESLLQKRLGGRILVN